jgi:hypothetical protein
MKVDSARGNVLPYLKQMEIVDDEGKTGDRARAWRDDELYQQVCADIIRTVYPSDLTDAVPNPTQNRSAAERWFANHTGTGEVASRKMAALYAVIAQGDPTKQPDQKTKERQNRTNEEKRIQRKQSKNEEKVQMHQEAEHKAGDGLDSKKTLAPSININLQVHISADATPDQIDQIFASMAKHIYHG